MGVEGAIVGKALYAGAFTLPDAGRRRQPVHASDRCRMTVAVRVIPCLDVDAGRVVKGVNFADLRDAGDPVELAAAYDAEGADELTFLDITASSGGRETTYDVVRRTAEQVFIPLTVGGGVRAVDDVDRLLRAGADKVGAQHRGRRAARAARRDRRAVRRQCIVLSVDARRRARRRRRRPPSGFEVTTHGGRRGTGIDAIEWARRGAELGAGEILLNSMDADGTKAGFDLELIRAVRAAVTVPVIASGGAGEVDALRSGGRRRAPTRCSRPASSTSGRCASARSRTRSALGLLGPLRRSTREAPGPLLGQPGIGEAGQALIAGDPAGGPDRAAQAGVGGGARAPGPGRPSRGAPPSRRR